MAMRRPVFAGMLAALALARSEARTHRGADSRRDRR